jgi:serine/threonine protein kinase
VKQTKVRNPGQEKNLLSIANGEADTSSVVKLIGSFTTGSANGEHEVLVMEPLTGSLVYFHSTFAMYVSRPYYESDYGSDDDDEDTTEISDDGKDNEEDNREEDDEHKANHGGHDGYDLHEESILANRYAHKVAYQLLKALDTIHDKGIIHGGKLPRSLSQVDN